MENIYEIVGNLLAAFAVALLAYLAPKVKEWLIARTGKDHYDAFQAMAKAGLSVEEVMEALEAGLTETSPRSSISCPRSQEYKRQGPLGKTRYGRPWSSWGASWLVCPIGQARGPPQNELDRPGQT